MNLTAECVLDAQAELAEGPVWDAAARCLWWGDIMRGMLHRFDPESGSDSQAELGQMIGAVATSRESGLVAAVERGFARVDPDTGAMEPIAVPDAEPAGNRFNDGKCDPAGRFWAGTMGMNAEPDRGNLYRLDPDGTVQLMLAGVSISNGLAWSHDGRTMYYIDTATGGVDAFDFDPARGTIARRRTVVRIPEEQGAPDGMCIDGEGKLWVAHWGGGQVGRWDPANGAQVGRVNVPCTNVTSCAFGGPHLRTLYITTARAGLDGTALKDEPLAGGLFSVELDVEGTLPPRFAG
jgi:sugar lactone lactonase YvrE